MSIKRHWPAIGGGLAFIYALWHFAGAVLGLGGDADFIIAHHQNPGWVGSVIYFGVKIIEFILIPPAWIVVPLIILSALLIWQDVKKSISRKQRYNGTMETAFAKKKILSLRRVRRDRSFEKCISYIINLDWDNPDDGKIYNASFKNIAACLLTIRQAAIDRKITVWGKKDQVWQIVDSDFWISHAMKFSKGDSFNVEAIPYTALMCSSKQFESVDWQQCRMEDRSTFKIFSESA